MLKTVALGFIILLQAVRPAYCWAQGADSAALARLENVWNAAHLRGDAAALDQLWADDLTVQVPGMQHMTKREVLAFARSGRMRFESYATSDLHYRVYGDAAVVTGRVLRARVLRGERVTDDWRFIKVYVRRSGSWQVVAFQASPGPQ